jgi:CRP-like cAMP-binding protein/NAD-dependent dihydropyrimidine dehydrogenase PreA subunit
VPACPADLNRADMVLLNKLKVEDSVPDHELMLQARTVAFPSGMTLDGLAHKLAELQLFHGASAITLRRLVLKSTLRMLVPGEELCKEGEFHERLCVVLSGMLEQQSAGAHGQAIHVLKLAQGSFFGEMGVLSDSAEPFTVVADELSIVLESPKIAVLRLMEQAPEVRASLDALYEKRALWSYSRNPGGLGALPEAAVAELLWSSRLELLPTGSTLCGENDVPQDLFLVRSGFLRASQTDHTSGSERVLTYFREGNVFGVLALLGREHRIGYSVQAASRSEVIRVPGGALAAVFARYPHAEAALRRAGFEAEALARAGDVGIRPHHPSAPGGVPRTGAHPLAATKRALAADVLVEEGLALGREILVIDQEKCTACSNCIDACERRHGNSRLPTLRRSGVPAVQCQRHRTAAERRGANRGRQLHRLRLLRATLPLRRHQYASGGQAQARCRGEPARFLGNGRYPRARARSRGSQGSTHRRQVRLVRGVLRLRLRDGVPRGRGLPYQPR